MASVQHKGNKYYAVYREVDPNTKESKSIWEPFDSEQEAESRLLEIKYQKDRGIFIAPNDQKISDYLKTFVEIYGTQNWGPSTYNSNVGLINNYIVPLIGDYKMKDFKSIQADKFIMDLSRTYTKQTKNSKVKEFLTDSRIEKIGKLLKTAFKQAEIWELVPKDPFKNTKLPKPEFKEREIWNASEIQHALDLCDDALLYIIINLAFSSSVRIGEALGLTWDCVAVDDESIANEDSYILIEKQLQRVNKDDVKLLRKCKVFYTFPSYVKRETKSSLMLIEPKTESSKRKIWLPTIVACMLRKWKDLQDENKDYMGNAYEDYNLVFANNMGRPITEEYVNHKLKAFQQANGLPEVVLHSLRHSSTTYKLKLNKGDLKATQGDTGHSTPDMIMKRYAHILDEDRKINAQKMEDSFYTQLNDVNRNKKESEPVNSMSDKKKESLEAFLSSLEESPDLREQLAKIISDK